MEIKDIHDEIVNITNNTLQKAYDYKYFKDGTEKLLQNIPAIDSLVTVSKELIELSKKIEKECNIK